MSMAPGREGDAGAAPIPPFLAFLEEQRAVVYRFLLATVGPSEADDCFQETFLAALRSYPRLRDGNNLRSWVLTIATRKAIDASRARRRRPVPDEDVPRLVGGADPGRTAAARPVGLGSGSASEVVDPEDPLWDAVRELPPKQRAAVVHRHVLDRSYAEIADVMGCSEEAARGNVSQGMRKLRTTMEAR